MLTSSRWAGLSPARRAQGGRAPEGRLPRVDLRPLCELLCDCLRPTSERVSLFANDLLLYSLRDVLPLRRHFLSFPVTSLSPFTRPFTFHPRPFPSAFSFDPCRPEYIIFEAALMAVFSHIFLSAFGLLCFILRKIDGSVRRWSITQ